MRKLCVTGTDTDAGKTAVTAALARAATDRGQKVLILKAVQTGCVRDADGRLAAPDLAVYREACPEAACAACVLFEPACSPHLAAREAGQSLSASRLAAAVTEAVSRTAADLVLLEGAGGLLTPLNARETLADCFALLGWPILLVGANKLGVVNHALLSCACAGARGLELAGFVLSAGRPPVAAEAAILADNAAAIRSLGGISCLADIPFLPALRSPIAEERASGWAEMARAVRAVLDATGDPEPGRAPEVRAAALLDFDREHLWHPYTSALHPLTAREAVSTLGTRIRLRDGRELVDGMASWWCAVHGYRHPRLLDALHRQAGRMPHVMFGGLTHEPAVDTARRLLDLAPRRQGGGSLEHVFFADSGSVAVEVAVKMALQYQRAVGERGRTRLMTVRGGYHGDTSGAMSVCDPVTGMHGLFAGLLPAQVFAPRPDCRFDAPYDPAPAEAFAAVLAAHAPEIAAVILEPVLQGAGGMWMYHPEFLRRVAELCREHGCLLILDEIATGFGRTGRLFACEHAGVVPDILCLGKALTGGVLSLAATLASREVARGLSRDGGVLMHGPTFMANPLACAVAGASLELLAEGGWRDDVPRIERLLREGLEPCRGRPGVADVRVLGAVGVLEMDAPVQVERAQAYFADVWKVWIRPFGRLIYVMPPYVSSDADIELLSAAMRGAVEEDRWN